MAFLFPLQGTKTIDVKQQNGLPESAQLLKPQQSLKIHFTMNLLCHIFACPCSWLYCSWASALFAPFAPANEGGRVMSRSTHCTNCTKTHLMSMYLLLSASQADQPVYLSFARGRRRLLYLLLYIPFTPSVLALPSVFTLPDLANHRPPWYSSVTCPSNPEVYGPWVKSAGAMGGPEAKILPGDVSRRRLAHLSTESERWSRSCLGCCSAPLVETDRMPTLWDLGAFQRGLASQCALSLSHEPNPNTKTRFSVCSKPSYLYLSCMCYSTLQLLL